MGLQKARTVGWQWHEMDALQIICTLLQTTMPASHHSMFCRPDGDFVWRLDSFQSNPTCVGRCLWFRSCGGRSCSRLAYAQPTVSKHWRQIL